MLRNAKTNPLAIIRNPVPPAGQTRLLLSSPPASSRISCQLPSLEPRHALFSRMPCIVGRLGPRDRRIDARGPVRPPTPGRPPTAGARMSYKLLIIINYEKHCYYYAKV